jgi:hypothetical protein
MRGALKQVQSSSFMVCLCFGAVNSKIDFHLQTRTGYPPHALNVASSGSGSAIR